MVIEVGNKNRRTVNPDCNTSDSKVIKSVRVTVDEVIPEAFEVILTKGNKQLIIDADYDLIATREGEHYSDFDEYILNLERRFDDIWDFLKNHSSNPSIMGEDYDE